MQTRRKRRQDHVRVVLRAQGRTLTWLARELDISVNYLHRLLLPAGHPDGRPEPAWFYPLAAELLGVPETMLRPTGADEAAA